MNKITKNFAEPSNIYESLSPFYYTAKCFGLASYSLNFQNGKMKTSLIHYVMMLCFITLFVFFLVNIFLTDHSSYSPHTKNVLIYGYKFVYLFQYSNIILIITFNFLKRGNTERFLKLLEIFDDHSEKMAWKFKIKHRRNYWCIIFCMIFNTILLISAGTLEMLWVPTVEEHDLRGYIGEVFYCIIVKGLILSKLQFIFGVQCVSSRFEILNQNTK